MSKHYSIAEAKNQLPAVIHEAEAGEPIEITRHGKAVAVVMSMAEYARLRGERPDLWAAYQAWRAEGPVLSDADIDALADESRGAEPADRIDWG